MKTLACLCLSAATAAGLLLVCAPRPGAGTAAAPRTNSAEPRAPQCAAPAARAAAAAPVAAAPLPRPAPASSFVPLRAPVEIRADGTQVYDGIPCRVRQPDGTMRVTACRLEIRPAAAVPVLPADRRRPH